MPTIPSSPFIFACNIFSGVHHPHKDTKNPFLSLQSFYFFFFFGHATATIRGGKKQMNEKTDHKEKILLDFPSLYTFGVSLDVVKVFYHSKCREEGKPLDLI